MYSYIICDDLATLVNCETGVSTTVHQDNEKFERFCSMLGEGDYANAEQFANAKVAVEKFVDNMSNSAQDFVVRIDGGNLFYSDDGSVTWKQLHNAIADRIEQKASKGYSVTPMLNFVKNMLCNPSKTAIDELYLFLENTHLPITEDGCFIAYKIVGPNYMDLYSGKFDNSVGNVCEMPRREVDDRRDKVCSNGLHFCSKEYLPHYGSHTGSKCMLVKINPADVVSIPSDYNNAKGRTCKYEVVGEVESLSWREDLTERDYVDSPVVDSFGEDVFDDYFNDQPFDEDELLSSIERLCVENGVFYSANDMQWKNSSTGEYVSRSTIIDILGIPCDDVITYEENFL